MTNPTSLHAYLDCTAHLDKALEDSVGIRLMVTTKAEAQHLRHRLNYCRQLHRAENTQLFQPGSPLYGRSVYDPLYFTIAEDEEGMWWVYLKKRVNEVKVVESLSEDDE